MLCTALLGVCLDRVWFRPLRQRQARAAMMAISSLGLALILQNLIRMLWGPQAQYYSRTIHFPFTVPVLQVRLNTQQVLIFAIALGLVILVSLFLQRTRLGKAMRATSDNFNLALVSGIDTERVVIWTWLLGAGLAAAGGILLGYERPFATDYGLGSALTDLRRHYPGRYRESLRRHGGRAHHRPR